MPLPVLWSSTKVSPTGAIRTLCLLQQRSLHLFHLISALGAIRTPNLLIRSQMLYPLSYERLPGPA